MLPAYVPDAPNGTRELTISESLIAYDNGIFEPHCDVEGEVNMGDSAGAVHFPETPWQAPVMLTFQHSGMVRAQTLLQRWIWVKYCRSPVFQAAHFSISARWWSNTSDSIW